MCDNLWYTLNTLGERVRKTQLRTTALSCFETSSMPKLSLANATEISSLPISDVTPTGALVAADLFEYGSFARMVFAYSFASNESWEKVE